MVKKKIVMIPPKKIKQMAHKLFRKNLCINFKNVSSD